MGKSPAPPARSHSKKKPAAAIKPVTGRSKNAAIGKAIPAKTGGTGPTGNAAPATTGRSKSTAMGTKPRAGTKTAA